MSRPENTDANLSGFRVGVPLMFTHTRVEMWSSLQTGESEQKCLTPIWNALPHIWKDREEGGGGVCSGSVLFNFIQSFMVLTNQESSVSTSSRGEKVHMRI